MLTLGGLYFYPVKSLRGIQLQRASVDRRGLSYDRHWMLVDAAGKFLSQRTHPKMAMIGTALIPQGLRLSAPGQLDLDIAKAEAGESLQVQVWGDQCQARSVGKAADQWLSAFLGIDCRLVFLPAESRRPVDPAFALPGDQVGFADGFPLLLISEASLLDLNSRLTTPVSMSRFRPNLVIRGCPPYAEDGWRQIRIGQMLFHLVKPCSRCSMITIDPQTGESGTEPLATLAGYRKQDNQVMFGQNLIQQGVGELRLDDEVEVLA